jgi:hypothetical protein
MKTRDVAIAALTGVMLLAAPLVASAQESGRAEVIAATTYLNGGLGKDRSIRRIACEFPLRISFSEGNGDEFAANVPVVISDARGNAVLVLRNAGPLLYVMLPDGTYTVTAHAHGETQTKRVTLDGARGRDINFNWTR